METTAREIKENDTKSLIKNTKSLRFIGKRNNDPKKYIRRKGYDISFERLLKLEIRLKN